jgi:uncharacterized protein (DUF58 family)
MIEARAFDPQVLAWLERLALGIQRSRSIRVGERSVGRIQGVGIEPENFRNYAPGDDLRFLDWNVFARLDDLVTRTYRATRQIEITLLVDSSASMGAPYEDDKLGLALLLAAALAYIAICDNNSARLVCFSRTRGGLHVQASPFCRRPETYPDLRPFVTAVRSRGDTALDEGVAAFLSERRPAGLAILISDFLVDAAEYESALARLLTAGFETKAIHVMGERESTGSFEAGLCMLRDAESGERRELVMAGEAIELYRAKVAELAQRLAGFCTRHAIAYAQAFGVASFERVMTRELPRLGVIR